MTYSFLFLGALLFSPGAAPEPSGSRWLPAFFSSSSEAFSIETRVSVSPMEMAVRAELPAAMQDKTPQDKTEVDPQQIGDSSTRPGSPASDDDPFVTTASRRRESGRGEDDFQWLPALRQSALFTGVMHSWRFATEKGTRDSLRGPWFKDWMRSVGELRGWDDGDGFITSYIGHPIQGSVSGFIGQQNDPRYRAVQFGDGRAYWISKLRSMAFAAITSTQWTLGPVSEASLGNTNLYASPGFVDLAVTPTLGTVWAIGEDIIDRYPIRWLEGKTSNPMVLLIARGFGNPTRSFANAMGMRFPWHRDSRPGLFGRYHMEREAMIAAGGSDPMMGFTDAKLQRTKKQDAEDEGNYPLEAPIELTATSLYERLGQQNCYGGGATGAARVNPHWQIVAELSGCLITGFQKYESGDSLTYMVGPRWAPRAAKRWSPYAQVLVGGRRVTHEILNAALRSILLSQWEEGSLPHYPERSAYQVQNQASGLAMAAGGGFDVRLNRALALRVANLEYTHSWLPVVDQIHGSDGLRFSAGLVLRIGTW